MSALAQAPPTAGSRSIDHRIVLAAVGVAVFITTLDNTVITIALPAIQRDLHLSLSALEWVSTSYILAFSCQLLAGGRAADVFGRRRCLLIGLGVFGLASLPAALARSEEMLIIARVLQGSGAALILPAGLAVLATDLGPTRRVQGVATWTVAVAVALSLGPPLGGAIVQAASWGWIFALNLPACALAAVALTAALPPGSQPPKWVRARGQLDLPGLLYASLAMLCLTWALVEGHGDGFASPLILGPLAATPAFAVAFVRRERRAARPLVDLGLFGQRVLAGATVAQILWGVGVNGVFFFTSLFLQDVLGLSPGDAGLAFLPLAGALVVAAALVPRIVSRAGAAATAATGLAAIAVGLVLVARLGAHAHVPALLPGLLLIGAGSGLTPPLTTSVLDAFPPERAGVAGGLVGSAREVSGVLGIAMVGAIVAAREHVQLRLGASASTAFLAGYRTALQVAAALVLLGSVVAATTLPRHGASG